MTADDVVNSISKTEFTKLGKRTTVCLLTMDFGMEVVGVAHCQNPDNFDQVIGESAAYNDAFNEAFSLCLARKS